MFNVTIWATHPPYYWSVYKLTQQVHTTQILVCFNWIIEGELLPGIEHPERTALGDLTSGYLYIMVAIIFHPGEIHTDKQ
jgi:hypothetical protein